MPLLEREAPLDAAVISHYQLVAPIMEQLFGAIPTVWAAFPHGLDQPPQWHDRYFGNYTRLSAQHVEQLSRIGALEFHSWSPTPEDPARCRFARLLLESRTSNETAMKDAATAVRTILAEEGRDAIPLLDGLGNITLWVPVAGAPAYDEVRAWAHKLAARVVQEYGDIVSTAFNTIADGRVHLHVSSNAVERWSILPYSFRARTGRVATPVRWDELQTIDVKGATLGKISDRLNASGEVFGSQLSSIACTPLTPVDVPMAPSARTTPEGNAHYAVINAAVAILSDGKTRSAEEIFKIGQERGLLKGGSANNLYSELLEYIQRMQGKGRKPPFIKTFDHKFRINEPADPWPDASPVPAASPVADVEKVVARLRTTSKDSVNSAEFEVAVCDAFAALGFLATHVGGRAAPDGYADAPLGTMGYRVMLECKSGSVIQRSPDVYEAAKYKDDYGAQYCALIGAESGTSQQEALAEIKTHGVSLWGVDDLAFALQHRLTLLDLEPAFGPGIVAADVLPDLLWAREHGQAKRVRIIADIIRSAGWATQCGAAEGGSPADAPVLTEDAAMLLVDQELAAQGAHVNCTREEVRLAFEWLTNPLNGAAAWNAEKTAIVVAAP